MIQRSNSKDFMRLCVVIPKLVPFQDGIFVGGSINAMVCLSHALAKAGHIISIVASSPEPGKEPEIREALSWAKVYYVSVRNLSPTRRGIETLPKMLFHGMRVCLRNGCDLVHSHSGYPYWAGLASMMGLFIKRPLVHTLYCPLSKSMNDKFHPLMNIPLAWLSLSAVNHIIAISRNVRNSLLAAGISSGRISVIPPPINENRFSVQRDSTDIRHQLNLADKDQILLFVGNLTQAKGFDILLKTIKALHPKWPRLRLIYTVERGPAITHGREKVIRELIANLGIHDRIIEFGIVKNMPKLMAACDVIVVPYRSTDGPSDYPMAMLEAMALGRPVVATRVGGIPEIIINGKTGVLVAPDDPAGLAHGIAAVLSAPGQAKAMGEAGTSIVRKRFVSTTIAQAMEQIYSQVLNQWKRGKLHRE
jgi:glycosyltransferase involved in cell wall biosynthesis